MLWLIHSVVWQNPTQYCKAIIPQIKIYKRKDTISIMQSHSFKYHLCADHPPPAPSCILNMYVNSLWPLSLDISQASEMHRYSELRNSLRCGSFSLNTRNSRQIYRISYFSLQQLEDSQHMLVNEMRLEASCSRPREHSLGSWSPASLSWPFHPLSSFQPNSIIRLSLTGSPLMLRIELYLSTYDIALPL